MLKIGDFARLGRVSVKALRHYDELGLLRPARVDRADGYRHYDPRQLVDLAEILLLKDFGFPLRRIAHLRRDRDGIVATLDVRHRELRGVIAADVARLKRLEAYREALVSSRDAAAVRLRAIEPVLALTERGRFTAGDDRVTRMFETLERRAAKARGRAGTSPFMLFHDAGGDDGLEVEACVPLKADSADLEGARIVEGHGAAGSVTYRGPYSQTPAFSTALAAWVDANGATLAGPLREVYHRFGADQRGYRLPARMLADDAGDYVTELQAPMATMRAGG